MQALKNKCKQETHNRGVPDPDKGTSVKTRTRMRSDLMLQGRALMLLGRALMLLVRALMLLGQALMMSKDSSLAAEAQELVGEAEEAIRSRQQRVGAALRALGTASDISDIGSIDLSGPRDHPAPSRMPLRQEGLPAVPAIERQPQAVSGPGHEMVELIQCLSDAQANDSGWPVFKERYEEYPHFRKEWWAYWENISQVREGRAGQPRAKEEKPVREREKHGQ